MKMRALSFIALVAAPCCVAPAPPSASATAPAPASSASSAPKTSGEAANGCEAPAMRRAMAQQLYRDDEFRGYICEEQACGAEKFLAGLTFDEVVLREAPRAAGCIVGPVHEAMTRIYGVFVLNDGAPSLALTYEGIDISIDRAFKKPGFKDLVGTERTGAGTWVTHHYVWSQRGYALERTTEDVDAP
ncbi:MAG TPA: hypothetical protein VEQ58_01020 [Polyangiaceae bacterium]|nr:hypothetical protein [Polyangiaceae bacterium]